MISHLTCRLKCLTEERTSRSKAAMMLVLFAAYHEFSENYYILLAYSAWLCENRKLNSLSYLNWHRPNVILMPLVTAICCLKLYLVGFELEEGEKANAYRIHPSFITSKDSLITNLSHLAGRRVKRGCRTHLCEQAGNYISCLCKC